VIVAAAGIIGQQIPIDSISDAVDTADVTTWDFVWAGVSIVVGVILSRIARATVRRYGMRASLPLNMIDLLGTIVMWTVVAVAVVFALTFVGLDVAPLWILIILIAVVFAVGGRSLLESFGAGILLQARSPFEPGDLVTLGADTGLVKEVNSRVVVIDTLDGRRIFVPNAKVLSEPIVNLTHRPDRMSELALDVVYRTDLDRAAAVAERALSDVDAVAADPPPIAQVSAFGESSITIVLRYWHASGMLAEWAATDAAARAVFRAYGENDIEFAFPQRTLWWGDDDRTPDEGDGAS
jgi:small conductance mechanosensitive channel